MFSKTISYTDYKGNERTETHWFNLTQAELVEMQMTTEGGLQDALKRIVEDLDGPEMFRMFKKFILASYGQKSADGRRFIKSDELSLEFSQTEAYNKLLMELVQDADAASDFMNGLVPDGIRIDPKEISIRE